MQVPWCNNIEVVQDSLAYFPSDGFTLLILLGTIGLATCYASWRYWAPENGLWLGTFMVVFSIWYFQEINIERHKAMEIFKSDKKVELVGTVSELQIEHARMRSKQYDVDAPWGYFHNPTSLRGKIWFKVGDQRVRSDVFGFTFKSGNKCNWWACGLEAGDLVRVSVDSRRLEGRPYKSRVEKIHLEKFYGDTLRIEKCVSTD